MRAVSRVGPITDRNIMRVTVRRNTRSTLAVLAATATSLAGLALPAQAANATVDDIAALKAAATSCANGDVITLGADIAAANDAVTTSCTMTLNLNEHALSIAQVVVTPNTTLTINGGSTGTGKLTAVVAHGGAAIRTTGASLIIDSGTITATPRFLGSFDGDAGIGGRSSEPAGDVTINGGTVTATGAEMSSGIGSGAFGTAGTVTINGGTVTATGGGGGAGIGGGIGSSHGTVTITGGDVTAVGGYSAAGIGSGSNAIATGGPATILGGTVIARGGGAAAGIGGGSRTDGGPVTIGADADVTAIGGRNNGNTSYITGIGGGEGIENPVSFGTLSVSGTLRIPTGANLTMPADATATVTSTGLITGSTGESDGGQIVGPGTIDNGGSIVLPDAQVVDASAPASITHHHYAVSFDTQGGSTAPSPVTVFAGSFHAGERAFPEPPTKAGTTFTGWSSEADGSGVPIDATSTLPGAATDGPLPVTAYAQYLVPPVVDPPVVDPPVVDPTPPVAGPSPTVTGLSPSIAGTPRERKILTARPGTVSPAGTTYEYQWLRDGRPIRGATAQIFTPGKADAGHRVSVRVLATASGAPTVVRTSPKTPRISSPYRRIVLADRSIRHGQSFRVTATGFTPGQRIRIRLGGTKVITTRADSIGTVSRAVTFSRRIEAGTRRVRVSGYTPNGDRGRTVWTTVKYR